MGDRRRKGDERPYRRKKGVPLNLTPTHAESFRWLPRQGEPSCIGEWFTQCFIRVVAFLPVYTAIVVTLCLVVLVLTAHPFGWGE
jgi:hypothetical protein